MPQDPEFTEKDLLDYATRIGVQARLDKKLDKRQIENIIALITEEERNPKESLLIAAAFGYRQVARGEIAWETARLISEALEKIYNLKVDEVKDYKEKATKLLNISKWVYESIPKQKIPDILHNIKNIRELTIEKFLEHLKGRA